MFRKIIARWKCAVRPAATAPRPQRRTIGLEPLEDRCVPAVFTVTTLADSGAGSLRQAMLDANAGAGADTIGFNIVAAGAKTIDVLSALPTLTGPTNLDGFTQNANVTVALNGAGAGAGVHGLTLGAGAAGSVVKGLSIQRFSGHGIMALSNGNTFDSNHLGTTPDADAAAGNGLDGLAVFGSGNLIRNNKVAANAQNGIDFFGTGAILNTVQNNKIGRAVQATARNMGNGVDGIAVNAGANGITIGGAAGAVRNEIAGNGRFGIGVTNGSFVVIQGNFIGAAGLGNGSDGIAVIGPASSNVQIGGNAAVQNGNAVAGNRIVGNGGFGVNLFQTANNKVLGNAIGLVGTTAVGNALGGVAIIRGGANQIGDGNLGGNVISGNGFRGIALWGATLNSIAKNIVGTDVGQSVAVGNALDGIILTEASSGNYLAANTFAGNGAAGVLITNGSNHTVVAKNAIGLRSGNNATPIFIGNALGVKIELGASDNTIGGVEPGSGNAIAAKTADGVVVDNSRQLFGPITNLTFGPFATGNKILGNDFVGFTVGLGLDPIDIGAAGLTDNDPGDADAGGNGVLNRPRVTGVDANIAGPGVGRMFGALVGGKPSTTFRVEFFLQAGSATLKFIGGLDVTTDASGNANFFLAVPASVVVSGRMTATATSAEGTSELAPPLDF